jgi:hypothetical protein
MAEHDVCRLVLLPFMTVFFARADVLALRQQRFRFSERASALNQINDQNNHGNYE